MSNLPNTKRAIILNMLVEGSSMRSISHVTAVIVNTAGEILVGAGEAREALHDATILNVPFKRVQCNKIWPFV